MYDLLNDTIISVRTNSDEVPYRVSLPELFAIIAKDAIHDLPGVRWHQIQALHCFLVQLGVGALLHSGMVAIPTDARDWREILRALSDDSGIWHLVQSDPTMPAFLQPPVYDEERVVDYKRDVLTPDDLDLLYSTKAHDIKPTADIEGDPEHWIHALINLQTASHYAGGRLYGISRMPSGISGRISASFTPTMRFSGWVKRDMTVLLATAEVPVISPIEEFLIWPLPWHGLLDERLDPHRLHPMYIDVSRRVRLFDTDGRISARYATSGAARITVGGDVGDPWAPIDQTRDRPFHLAEGGWTWFRMCRYLLDEKWRWPLLFSPQLSELDSSQAGYIVARGYSRVQGKIDGYYVYKIPVSASTISLLATEEGFDVFRQTVQMWQKATNDLRMTLRTAIGSQEYSVRYLNYAADGLDPWIEERFWNRMQTVSLDDWKEELAETIRGHMAETLSSIPAISSLRADARRGAEAVLNTRLNRLLNAE